YLWPQPSSATPQSRVFLVICHATAPTEEQEEEDPSSAGGAALPHGAGEQSVGRGDYRRARSVRNQLASPRTVGVRHHERGRCIAAPNPSPNHHRAALNPD